ncbi:ABC transporter C family protein (macronuclear) [Tetrahymena thermophila SB210]|uniref:ABC transporter C family protein n=1 Tax=Tetrahymena thermophila (strain SB210) TaxID=312017 RepID=Q241Y3_TETTS|nr:ABC transporter C family protein [Tetrahymena thermophila SB210]EAS02568.3 ABC transporter C family protein [Tetrahymena thermophila SB210]|eukprot:XP_001022813.3 ABC transporter C family protein [Tetrahymena thermophila SB210]
MLDLKKEVPEKLISLNKEIQLAQNFDSSTNQINFQQKKELINGNSFILDAQKKRNNIFFTNLNGLFTLVKNLQNQGKQIQNNDIKSFVSDSCQMVKTIEKIEQYKRLNPQQFSNPNKLNLFRIHFYITRKQFLLGLFFFTLQSILECCCTYFLDLITETLKTYSGNYEDKKDLFLLLIAITLFYLAKNICYTRYFWYEAEWKAKSLTTLQYIVFNKSLRIKNTSEGTSIDLDENKSENSDEIPDINNVMTTDIEGVQEAYREIIGLIVNIITVIIVLIMIYLKIGSHLINGLYVLLVFLMLCVASVHFLFIFDIKVNSAKDSRVSLSKDIIEGIKNIKYLGWENIFKQKIEKIRGNEVKFTKLVKVFDIFQNTVFNMLSYFMIFTLLVSFVNDGNQLVDSNIFTLIALYNVIYLPLIFLPWNVSSLTEIYVQYKRIINFLNQQEIDFDNVVNLEELNTAGSKRKNSYQINANFEQNQSQLDSLALQIKNAYFSWPQRKQCNQQEIQQNQIAKMNSENTNLIEIQSQSEINSNENKNAFQLKIQDFTIQKGDLAIIIGKIGSGKSALLQAILNELEGKFGQSQFEQNSMQQQNQFSHFENKILVNGKVGYVSQNHWLQNKSIKENILFGREFDASWYQQCIESCDLQVDFSQFSKKDDKLVGSGGGNLSGGQRQRVAICRAIYQNCDIYLFDDIFSSLDAHVADHIYQSVILGMLIKKLQKTVILVTSHFSIFSQRQNISKIYYLREGQLISDYNEIEQFIQNGITQEQSDEKSHNHNQKQKQHNSFIESKKTLQANIYDEQIPEKMKIQKELKTINQYLNETENVYSEENLNNQQIQEEQKEENSDKSEKEEEGELEEEDGEEEREKGNIKLSTFKVYFMSIGIVLLVSLLICNLLAPASQMLIDYWLKDYISPSQQWFFVQFNEIFQTFTLSFIFLIVLQTVISIVRGILIYKTYLISSTTIFKQLNQSIIFSRMSFFDKNPIGGIVNRLSDDVQTVDNYLPWSLDLLLGQAAPAFLYTLAILAEFPWLAMFILIQFILISFVQKDFRLLSREVKRLNSVNSGRVLTILDESSKGLVIIRSFKKQKHIVSEYLSKLSDFVNTDLITQAVQIWLSLRLIFISNLIFICVSVTTIVLIFGNFDFEYTTIAMCITYSMIFSSRFSEVVRFLNYFEMNIVSIERIQQYFNNQQEDLDSNQINLESDVDLPNLSKLNQENIAISFENVYLTYDEIDEKANQSKEQNQIKYALENICLKIKKGEKIAFCGRTGSGKTSILNAIFRMYPIKQGRIYLNGKDIQSQSLRQIRTQMSIIPQFGFVYNASLIDNIDPERKIAREEIQKKVNETNLRITKNRYNQESQLKDNKDKFNNENEHLISQQDEKQQDLLIEDENLDFEIEDGGQNLSNGEKQVINFLRVIMRDTEIICLDEATSNMDPETDLELHKQIFKYAEKKTLLVITHRLENIELFDRVVVLEKGRIVECGHVQELRQIQGGFFNKLIKNN